MNHPGFQEDVISDWAASSQLGGDAVSGAQIAAQLPSLPLWASKGEGINGSQLAH